MYDKDMKCWVSAGFGFVAVKGGDGPEHDGGSSIHEHQGPVDLGDFGGAVTQKTNNVSELVAESVKSVTSVTSVTSCFHPSSVVLTWRSSRIRSTERGDDLPGRQHVMTTCTDAQDRIQCALHP